MKRYDYLIVGSGLYGAVFAHEAMARGKSVLVIEKREHIGGNIYTEKCGDINVHKYGAHIFHTSDKSVWEYVNNFASFNNYINSPIAIYHDEVYNLPFNMNTFNKMWGVKTPDEARAKIDSEKAQYHFDEITNLEEQAISMVGEDIYKKLIKEYTEKQWGRDCKELPSFIIRRLPLRFIYDNNYFNDTYQGIPIGGYTAIIDKMLEGAEVMTSTDYYEFIKRDNKPTYDKVVFTGMIDEFFGYRYGHLEYRSVRFETDRLDIPNYQGNAVVNYTSHEVPYTRIIEHKHFEKTECDYTVISREYSTEWRDGIDPYYPINNETNSTLYAKYRQLADNREDVIFGGRLGKYKYYDMDKVIAEALADVKTEFGE